MKVFPLLLCAAAGLAGWRLASAGDEDRQTSQTGPTRLTDSPPAVSREESNAHNACTGEPHGSAGLAGLPAQLGSITYDKALDLAYALPEGPAQAVVMALLEVRRRPPADPFADPFSDPSAEREENRLAELVKKLTSGLPEIVDSGDEALLRTWAQSDPAAACAVILKAPPGLIRAMAADEVAGALAKLDPSRAMELVLQAGGEEFGQGAARAWAELAMFPPEEKPAGKSAAAFMNSMTPAQRDSLLMALTDELGSGRFSGEADAWGGFLQNSPLWRLTRAAWEAFGVSPEQAARMRIKDPGYVQPNGNTPGFEAFFAALAHRPEAMQLLEVTPNSLSAGQRQALEILAAKRIADLNPAEDADLLQQFTVPFRIHDPFGSNSDAALNRAAPRLLPNLVRSGHLTEAVQILDNIHDRTAWRESFEAMLPAWMDADPAKARAAFEKAPLTALERERWERHPAFLLNP